MEKQSNIQLWIPEGFAHGFLALENNTIFQYKVTNTYSKEHERSLNWKDPKININWPELDQQFIISRKDSQAPSFEKLNTINSFFK